MSDEDGMERTPDSASADRMRLAFMLSQLRDDLDELVGSLESGTLSVDTATAAAITQLQWLMQELTSPKSK